MTEPKTYTESEVKNKLSQFVSLLMDLDNGTPNLSALAIGGIDDMPKRFREKVTVNGKEKWVSGYSVQELMDNYVSLLEQEGIVERIDEDDAIPYLNDYVLDFYRTFKTKQESLTKVNRDRIIKNHILPAFEKKRLDRIKTTEIQKWLSSLGEKYSKETVLKIKNTLNPVLDAAVEEEYITMNPLRSSRIEITGKETVSHKAIPKDKMKQIKMELNTLDGKEKLMASLLCYTGMRFEEILGLKWDDMNDEYITICRAVVHPKRNMPEVKKPKTASSNRMIPFPNELKELLDKPYKHGYILYSDKDPKRETPLSYTESRRIYKKIRDRFNLSEYTAHDFRDTCATEWREKGVPLDVIARWLGHSKTEITEKRYVKYRTDMYEDYRQLM